MPDYERVRTCSPNIPKCMYERAAETNMYIVALINIPRVHKFFLTSIEITVYVISLAVRLVCDFYKTGTIIGTECLPLLTFEKHDSTSFSGRHR